MSEVRHLGRDRNLRPLVPKLCSQTYLLLTNGEVILTPAYLNFAVGLEGQNTCHFLKLLLHLAYRRL